MKKHIIDEKTGIGYTLQGDYYIPDLTLPPEKDKRPIGIWGAGVRWTPLQKQKHRPSRQARHEAQGLS